MILAVRGEGDGEARIPLDLPQELFDRQACDTGAIFGPDPIPHRGSTIRIHRVFQDPPQHRCGKV